MENKEFNGQSRPYSILSKNMIVSEKTKRFHWDIITMCNYHCTYCYSREEDSQWNKITTKPNLDIVIEKFKQINSFLEITLLGGEPTKHPQYFYILDELFKIEKLSVIEVITNGSFKNPEEFIVNHLKYLDKFIFRLTFHPSEIEDMDVFKQTLLTILKYNFPLEVNVLLIENYLIEADDIINFCINNNVNFRPSFLFKDDVFVPSTDVFKKGIIDLNNKYHIKKEIEFSNNEKTTKFNEIDTYLKDLNKFKGWKCKQKTHYIRVATTAFVRACVEKEVTCDEINNPDNDYITCPMEYCTGTTNGYVRHKDIK